MAEDKRANPFPFPTAAEVEAVGGERHLKAARNIAVRGFNGIPKRGFLLGSSDHSPVMRGIVQLTSLCYEILDEFAEESNTHPKLLELRDMLEDHGCQNEVRAT